MGEHVRCPWDGARFAQALMACVGEHPILRTGFLLEGERPLQVVYTAVELPLEVEDLRGLPDDEQEHYLSEWTERRKRHVFDWERGPLFSVHIFRRTDESFQFTVSFHHAVLDGWSKAVFTTELYNRYERLLSGKELELAEAEWTYRDFIAQEQRVIADPEARQHFARMLEEAPAQQLPRLKSVAASGERTQGHLIVEGFTPLSGRLIELSRQLGVPVQAVLLAGHFKVLAMMSGQCRAVSCVTHNGRPEREGAERSLGLYLNSLPLSIEPGEGTWRGLIGRVAELSAASMQYRDYPLSKIQQDVGAVFEEVTFNYVHFHVYNERAAGGGGRELEVLESSGFEQTNFDFHVDVSRGLGDDSLRMAMIYDAGAFDAGLIERVAGYYVLAYDRMLEGLDEPHDARTLLGEGELRRLLLSSAGEEADYPLELCFHEPFARPGEHPPSPVAVLSGAERLRYGELEETPRRLARSRAEAGVGPESRVGIHLRRSP